MMAEEESKEMDGAEETQEEELLLPQEELLSAGVHIGTKMKTKDMEPFIYRVRPDGLFVLDVKKTNERIKVAAKFLARFEPSKIAVVAARLYAREPVRKFCEVTGAIPVVGRFVPGSLSNPLYPRRIEPDVVVVSECSTDNNFSNIDLVIPTNNKGRRALAIIYWLLARQFLREKGEIPPDGDLPIPIEEFEVKLVQRPV